MQVTVAAFLDHLDRREKKASRHTVAAYRNDLTQFLDRLVVHGVTSLEQVSQEHVADFLHWLQEKDYAVSTVARKVAAVRSFFHFAVAQGILKDDPSAAVTPPEVKREPPQLLSVAEVERLLQEVRGRSSPKMLRDWALLALMCATGVRASELIHLSVASLNLEQQWVRCGSEVRERQLPLTAEAVEALRSYLQRGRPQLVKDAAVTALFVNYRGNPLTRQGLWLIVKKWARTARIRSEISPHTLRHSFAARLLDQGVELEELQERLGHATPATTQVYVQDMEE